jgi:hypothetical protein|tara:strand:+ start:257 stop:475 length:219 start_codon:yes stop_codon:yes gene_type:complete
VQQDWSVAVAEESDAVAGVEWWSRKCGTSGVAAGFFPTTTSEKSKRRGLRRAETDSTVFALGSIEYYQQYSQ